jgi:proteasome lid subunit RPN8/RPN11
MDKLEMDDEAIASLQSLIYEGRLMILPNVEEAIEERIRLWSDKDPKVEWAAVLCGSYRAEGEQLMPLVTSFVELPSWNLSREHSLAINLNDIARIAEQHHVLALLHSHPSGEIFPSAQDIATFIYCDILLGRPLLYVIATPKGEKLILSFEKCHRCPSSFLRVMKSVQGLWAKPQPYFTEVRR